MGAVAGLVGSTLDMFGVGEGDPNTYQTNVSNDHSSATTNNTNKVNSSTSVAQNQTQNTTQNQSQTGEYTQGTTRTVGAETDLDRLLSQFSTSNIQGLNADNTTQQNNSSQMVSQLNDLFRNTLVKFAASDFGSKPTPDQIAEATSYVDQTFTVPAQRVFDQQISKFEQGQAQKAAALGRTSLDSAYQNDTRNAVANTAADLGAQRGVQIAQKTNDIAYTQPMQNLNSLGQSSNFFNTQLQNAINNRVGLLNLATGQQSLGQNIRLNTGTSTTGGTNTSLGTSLGSATANTTGTSLTNGTTNSTGSQVVDSNSNSKGTGTPPTPSFGSQLTGLGSAADKAGAQIAMMLA